MRRLEGTRKRTCFYHCRKESNKETIGEIGEQSYRTVRGRAAAAEVRHLLTRRLRSALLRGVGQLDPEIHSRREGKGGTEGDLGGPHDRLNNRTRGVCTSHGKNWRTREVKSGLVGHRPAFGWGPELAECRRHATLFPLTYLRRSESRIGSEQISNHRRKNKIGGLVSV
jgi:hypothetical protein